MTRTTFNRRWILAVLSLALLLASLGRNGRAHSRRRALKSLRRTGAIAAVAAVAALPSGLVGSASAAAVSVCPTVETDQVHSSGDAADDSAIWIHPTDTALSTLIGTDKSTTGGLNVYALSGTELAFKADGRLNNDDIRYNFPLGAERVSLLGATNRVARTLDFYRIVAADRSLVKVGSVPVSSILATPRGFALYHSPVSGKYYAFVTDSGKTLQYELSGATGQVTGAQVRQLPTIPNATEGLVADDELGRVYIGEEDIGGIWRFGAEPTDSTLGVKVAKTTENGGPITQDVKGLTIYYGSGGAGYLIAASQGASAFDIFNRGDNAFVGEFKIAACSGIDAVTGEDGIDVTNFGLGSRFPQGFFTSTDFTNEGNQNHKLVPWQSIANAFSPALVIDPSFDPRKIGAPDGPDDITPPTVGSIAPAAGATSVAVGSSVQATFSESMDAATITTATFTLAPTSGGAPVSAVVGYDDATRTATLDPSADLSPGTSYTATVTTGVKDRSGNALAAARTWSFTTATGTVSGAIKRESTSTVVNTTATSAVTVTTPAGTDAADVLVSCLALNGGAVASSGAPPGWSKIAGVTTIANPHVFGYYKVAGALEPSSYRWTLTGSVVNGAGIARYSGVNPTAPLDATVTTASGPSATSGTLPGVTTVSPNAMLAGCMAINSSSTSITMTAPAGMTKAWDIGGKRDALADRLQAAAGPSGTKTWTFSSAREWAGWLTALRPQN
jgi:myo-inositol-hexaphosphate 3-phosphohydrolase